MKHKTKIKTHTHQWEETTIQNETFSEHSLRIWLEKHHKLLIELDEILNHFPGWSCNIKYGCLEWKRKES